MREFNAETALVLYTKLKEGSRGRCSELNRLDEPPKEKKVQNHAVVLADQKERN